MSTISKDRWDWIISEVINLVSVEIMFEKTELKINEVELVKSVLKNNTPFEVCNNTIVEVDSNEFV